jgi:hypothetical protein
MSVSFAILAATALILVGIVIDRIFLWVHGNKQKEPVNPIPSTLPKITDEDHKVLQVYMDEWKTVIETQMHFNDLILRFRSVVLTAFVAFVAAVIAIDKLLNLSRTEHALLGVIPLTLWTTAFIIDFFFYHKLLLGSVTQALKFDKSPRFQQIGLFGMTTCISNHVHPPTSKILVCIYYALPFAAGIFLMHIFGQK